MFRCKNVTNDTTSPDYNRCASDEEINKWLYNKQLEPLTFDIKPALTDYKQILRMQVVQFPAIPFKPGIKTDYWFRY